MDDFAMLILIRKTKSLKCHLICFRISKNPIVSSPLKYDSLKRKSRHFLLACICGFGTNRRAEKSAIWEWSRDTQGTTRFHNVDLSEVVRWEVVDCWPIPSCMWIKSRLANSWLFYNCSVIFWWWKVPKIMPPNSNVSKHVIRDF